MSRKTAVILFNLGGPDQVSSIRPFLINFFMDKNIIRAPWLVRFFVSRLIAYRRSKNEAGTSYGMLGGKSPLLENTQAQADALQSVLGDEFKVFVVMRYWHPMAAEVVQKVQAYQPDELVLLPLYPQYSTTTTRSSFQDWFKAATKAKLTTPTQMICCYPFNQGFIAASVANIKTAYDAFVAKYGFPPRLLFSAHGLPEKVIAEGDSYQWACEESAAKIAAACAIENLDWSLCYQSRVGPLKWIGPSTEEALKTAANDHKGVLIYPHAFVNEHVETLVEIEEEYRHVAHELGISGFERVPTVSCHPAFIAALADLVRNQVGARKFPNAQNPRLCPMQYCQCCHNEFA
ncbi:MAG TPA: ferrochelatase [Rhodospirillaceae bacterium]|nr:ferrochelatase [Rhodospirillaceae bacterium]